ncbi:MAG TPA: hypothetical protein VJ385_10485 [Fibrobacteria bacterium]|nr:hypothetical protein [Fibrobacteria bacterium]
MAMEKGFNSEVFLTFMGMEEHQKRSQKGTEERQGASKNRNAARPKYAEAK